MKEINSVKFLSCSVTRLQINENSCVVTDTRPTTPLSLPPLFLVFVVMDVGPLNKTNDICDISVTSFSNCQRDQKSTERVSKIESLMCGDTHDVWSHMMCGPLYSCDV